MHRMWFIILDTNRRETDFNCTSNNNNNNDEAKEPVERAQHSICIVLATVPYDVIVNECMWNVKCE